MFVVGTWLLVLSLLAQPILAVTVDVRIEGPDKNIFKGQINTTDVTIEGQQINADKAAAALESAAIAGGFSTKWNDTAWGLMLDSIAGIANKADWSASWAYRVNCKVADFGFQTQQIKDNDNVVIFYSPYPYPEILKLEVSKTTLVVGESVSIKTSLYNYDSRIYENTSATVEIGNKSYSTDNNGDLSTTFNTNGTYEIGASKGQCASDNKTIIVNQNAQSQNNPQLNPPAPKIEDLSGIKPVSQRQARNAAMKAVKYLRLRQSKDGMIDNPAVSAWAAMAFASANVDPKSVKRAKGVKKNKRRSLMDYLQEYSQTNLNRNWLRKNRKAAKPLATDYARQIMAVYAARQNPRSHGGVNLVTELGRFYNNGQFGSTGLVNDDIFAIIAYRAGQVSPGDRKFRRAISFVLKNQHADGGFSYNTSARSKSDIDTTAAAIQALVLARKSGVRTASNNSLYVAIQRAYDFLLSKQQASGGFGYNSKFSRSNSQSTAWAMQAIASFKGSKSVRNMKSSAGLNPMSFQASLQSKNGGFRLDTTTGSRVWETASAIPALLNKPWLIRYRSALSINASKKLLKKGQRVKIFGRIANGAKGIVTIRYKKGRGQWKTARRIRVNGSTYGATIRLNSVNRYVFSAKIGSAKSRAMVINSK